MGLLNVAIALLKTGEMWQTSVKFKTHQRVFFSSSSDSVCPRSVFSQSRYKSRSRNSKSCNPGLSLGIGNSDIKVPVSVSVLEVNILKSRSHTWSRKYRY